MFVLAPLLLFAGACAGTARPTLAPEVMSQFWEEPVELARRDLFNGPGGAQRAPDPREKFQFVELKATGFNPGYDVKDSRGREWSVKLGVESRIEVTVSRLMSALGYHQPYIYYLRRWTLTRDGRDTVIEGEGARFRLDLPNERKEGEWSWRKNPFLDTQPFAGLAVLMVMVNNWDIKTAQNALYVVAQDGVEMGHHYVVRDVGAAFGRTAWASMGTKDDPEEFEKETFIDRVEGNRVLFHYKGAIMEPHLLDGITPADVRWICGLMARLTDQQLSDAFRAGGFSDAEASRHIKRLKEKIQEGLRVH